LSEALNRTPDFVITNSSLDRVNAKIGVDFRLNNDEAKTLDILENLEFDINSTLITLNGWLRIVPPDKCLKYNIYNGHPGLITKYPELKGKDPQERTWDNLHKYDVIGSVVHQVVEEVDAGEIVAKEFLSSSSLLTLDDTYSALRRTSFRAWYRFLKERLYNKV